MSNNVLVKNSTYYSSSLNEGNSVCIINNREEFDITREVQLNVVGAIAANSKLIDVIANGCTVPVINGTIEEKYEDPSTIIFNYEVTRINDLVEKRYVNYPVLTQNISQTGFCITVVQEEEVIKDAILITALVNNLNIDEEFVGETFDTINKHVNEEAYDSNSNYNSAIKHVANLAITSQNEYLIADSLSALIKKEMTKDYVNNTKMSIAISAPIDEEEGYDSQPVIELDVANSHENGEGNNNGNGSNIGGDLNLLSFTIQQMSFFEFKLRFKEKKVVDVFNLPQGLFFDAEGQRIIGTPMLSGSYNFTLIFDNSSILNGFIDVPKVRREL